MEESLFRFTPTALQNILIGMKKGEYVTLLNEIKSSDDRSLFALIPLINRIIDLY